MPVTSKADERLLALLPAWEFSEAVDTRVAAGPRRAFEAALAVTVREMLLSSTLLTIRGLPGLIRRRRLPRWGSGRPFWKQLLAEPGFTTLLEPQREYAAFGYVGRPWKPAAEGRRLSSAQEFVSFDEPGYAKVVMDLEGRPEGNGSVLRTETRIHLTDESARRAFARYWALVRLGSIAVRKDWLRAARRRAERGDTC